jgi:hypothetical protein
MLEMLDSAVKNLVAQIQSYESDTFSAAANGIDLDRAEAMAAMAIEKYLFDKDGFSNTIDGVTLGYVYDELIDREVGMREELKSAI